MKEIEKDTKNMKPEESVKILFTGDFCPVYRPEQLALSAQYDVAFGDIIADFQGSDLNVVDLECPLIESGTAINKTGPSLKALPSGIGLLKYANIGLVALANNHINDYGADGLLRTMALCNDNDIATVGAGVNLETARKPYKTNIKGKNISILNFTDNEWSNTNGPKPGANPLDLIKNYQDIKLAKDSSDFVIVIYHGGNEFYELPGPRVKEMMHFFADCGASAIISHHTHVSSGYEIYKRVPIFYGLGNFCYDWPDKRDNFWNYGFVVKIDFSETISFEIIPFEQNNHKPGVHKLEGEEKKKFLDRIHSLNEIIANDELLLARFEKHCAENAFRYDIIFEPYHCKYLASLRKRKLIPSLITTRRKRLFLNIIRCESHRELLLWYLNRYK